MNTNLPYSTETAKEFPGTARPDPKRSLVFAVGPGAVARFAALAFLSQILLWPGELQLTIEEEQKWISANLAAENSTVLVAKSEDKIVGVLSCRGGEQKGTRHTTTLGISVHQHWRNQGVGRALMERAIAWAKETGVIKRIQLEVTAGNAPGVNDGASALVLMSAERAKTLGLSPLARIVGQAASGIAPKMVLMTPVEAVRRLMKKTGWRLEDVDLFELNEAFSVQAVAVIRELGLDSAKVNVHGGAVALGHAIGSSGSRILTTLLYALKQRNLTRGVATLCMGGGNGLALAIELP